MALSTSGVTDYSYSVFSPSVDDQLLASVAIRVQLSPSLHRKAVERYETIGGFLDEHPALLADVLEILPQGSMATGTTVAARKDEEFDIDLVAVLSDDQKWRESSPAEVLNNFFDVFSASTRYRGKVVRNTRCVTLHYSDDMHLDVTPLQLRDAFDRGWVMNHRYEDRFTDRFGRRVPSSPKPFARWFDAQMPDEPGFALFIEGRALEFERNKLLAEKADVQQVPDHEPAFRKPRAKICLQLIKRFRNLRYENREGRSPPSVLLSMLVAEAAKVPSTTTGLLDELQRIVSYILDAFLLAKVNRETLARRSPVDVEELFTDRWPEKLTHQEVFINDLLELQTKLAALRDARLEGKFAILKDIFGESPAREATKALSDQLGQSISDGRQAFAKGGTAAVTFATPGPKPESIVPRRKDFFGGEM